MQLSNFKSSVILMAGLFGIVLYYIILYAGKYGLDDDICI